MWCSGVNSYGELEVGDEVQMNVFTKISLQQ